MEVQPQATQPAIQPNRLAFDEELFKRSEEFCTKLMESIPELGGVAIVPLWITQPEKMPPALLRLRDPNGPPMAPILKLVENLMSFSQSLTRELVSQYRMFDNYAAELAARIKEHEEKLNTLQPEQQSQPNANE